MNVLLLIGKSSTSHEAVAAEAEELRRQGHHVTVGTRVPPRQVLVDAVDSVVQLSPALPAPPVASVPPGVPAAGEEAVPAATPEPAPTPSARSGAPAPGITATARKRVRQLRAQVSGAVTEPARSWRAVRRNATVMQLAREADVIVAVDAPMVRAVWHLGRRLPLPAGPEVVYGLPAAATAIARRTPSPR